jgi:coenzyme F420-reducing hydrogenase delta subunit
MKEAEEGKKKEKKGTDKDDKKVIGFFCHWCTSTAADLAGTTRKAYPAAVRPIRVMCTGSVDPAYMIDALVKGADAVWVGG